MDSACAPHIISPHINSPTTRHPSRHVHLYWYVHTKTLTAHGRLSVCVHACMYMYIHIYPALRCALPGPSMRPALNAVDQRWSRPPVYAAMTFSASAEVEGAGAEGGGGPPAALGSALPLPAFFRLPCFFGFIFFCMSSHESSPTYGRHLGSTCVFAMRVRNACSQCQQQNMAQGGASQRTGKRGGRACLQVSSTLAASRVGHLCL